MRALQAFTVKDLAVILERSMDMDAHLLNTAFRQCGQQKYRTEAITLIYMVQD